MGSRMCLVDVVGQCEFGPPTASRRNDPGPWVSLPGPTSVMTHPGSDESSERQPFSAALN